MSTYRELEEAAEKLLERLEDTHAKCASAEDSFEPSCRAEEYGDGDESEHAYILELRELLSLGPPPVDVETTSFTDGKRTSAQVIVSIPEGWSYEVDEAEARGGVLYVNLWGPGEELEF